MRRAVWAGAQEQYLDTDWGRSFRAFLATCQGDLFGTERIEAELARFESSCPTTLTRLAVDVAFAEVYANRLGPDLESRVTRATLELAAQNQIEGAVSWVADQHKETQVRELRATLLATVLECDFLQPPTPKKRKAKLTVSEGLELELPLKVDCGG